MTEAGIKMMRTQIDMHKTKLTMIHTAIRAARMELALGHTTEVENALAALTKILEKEIK